MGVADKKKYYPGRVAYDKSVESICLAFKNSFESVHCGITFEIRTKLIQYEKARHGIYEKKVATHSFLNDGQGKSVCYTIIVWSNTLITQ